MPIIVKQRYFALKRNIKRTQYDLEFRYNLMILSTSW